MNVQQTWPQHAGATPQLEQPRYVAPPQYPAAAIWADMAVNTTAMSGAPNKRVMVSLLQAGVRIGKILVWIGPVAL
jgi:hypothetical protein